MTSPFFRPFFLRRFLIIFILLLIGIPLMHSFLSDELRPFRPSSNFHTTEVSLPAMTVHAEQGDPVAQFKLGEAYKGGGYGLPQNYDEASIWFRKAAEQGYAPAERAFGTTLLRKSKDDPEAYKWFQKAADQGDLLAQEALAVRGNPALAWITLVLTIICGIAVCALPVVIVVMVCRFIKRSRQSSATPHN